MCLTMPFLYRFYVHPRKTHALCFFVLENGAPAADDDWEIPEMEFIDQPVLEERAIEASGAVLHDVLPRLALEARDFAGDIPLDGICVPGSASV